MKVVYVHGMGSQVNPRSLKARLDYALFEQESEDSIVCYYADINHPIGMQLQVEDLERDLVKNYLKDVADYLWTTKQKRIEERLVSILDSIDEPFILIAHSLGSVIAFKVLHEYKKKKLDIPTFITIGSPLGLDQLKVELLRISSLSLSKPPGVLRWYNIADVMDIVASDKTVADDYSGRLIKDILIINPDTFSTQTYGSHSLIGYVKSKEVRSLVTNSILMNSNPVTRILYRIG